ncbi:MAG: homogentisate 1,2-dioxygenase [Gemmataceae bacterium]
MLPYRQLGKLPPKRHIMFRHEPGFRGEGIYYEEVITTAGFGRAHSICYHLRPPTRVRKVEDGGALSLELVPETTLRHHHIQTGQLPAAGNPISGRVPLLFNDDVLIARCRPTQRQIELYRNATADELIFIHKGAGKLHTMYGVLPFRPVDYVVIPRATTYRLEFDEKVQPDLLLIESTGNLVIPAKYLNPDGQLRLGAPFGERDLHGPSELVTMDKEEDVQVLVKDGRRLTRYTLAHHPFDVVGWDGMVYPYTFNADDFEPITGTVHQPPPIHQTFDAPGFVVCTFAPRLLDTHPEAIKVPYAHSNVQADEVLYYVRGRFGSRRGVEEASITLHPRGIPHGPHPGTIAASKDMTRTDELAVMVDTIKPLALTRQALEWDDESYPYSWLE